MKQVLHSYRTGELTVAEVPVPAAEPGELLVRTGASLVSAGTEKMALDLGKRSLIGKAQDRPDLVQKTLAKVQRDGLLATARTVVARLDEPVPLGYSCAGVVLEVGRGVEGYQPGDRVACAGAKIANHAEVNAVPLRLCAKVPGTLGDEEAAFVTVGAIALQGIRTAAVGVGECVAVIGLGLIGQLAVQILRAAGCKVLGIDLEPGKLELALAGGAQATVLRSGEVSAAVAALSDGRGMDAVIICAAASSNDPIELAAEIARDRGRVVVVGAVPMDLPRRPFYDKELSLLLSRSYGPGRYDPGYEEHGRDYPAAYVRWTEERNFGAFLELCSDRRVDVRRLISHRFPIDQAGQAYRLLSGENHEPYLGILLTYPERELKRTISLGKSAGTGAGATRAAVATKAAEERVGEVRLGFAGAGAFAGSVLLPAFAKVKRARLKTIVSARGISARHLGLRFGFSDASTSFDELCADRALDAVVISTRHHLHAAQTIEALKAAKHVFVEKPMGLSREEIEAVRKAAARSEKILLVGFNRRFAPLSLRLAQFFEDRTAPLAMLYRVNAGPIPPSSWIRDPAVGGGRIVGEVCHFVDLLSLLARSPPVRVQASGSGGSAGTDAQLAATLTFADGSIGTIVYSGDADPAFPKERVEVMGQGRIAVLEDFRTLEMSVRGKRSYARSTAQDKGHQGEVEAFVRAIGDGAPSPIALESLCATSLATLAIEDALRSGEAKGI